MSCLLPFAVSVWAETLLFGEKQQKLEPSLSALHEAGTTAWELVEGQ